MDAKILEHISRVSDNERLLMSMSESAQSESPMLFDNLPLRRRDYVWNVVGNRQMVSTHTHIRFADIPMHSHNYIEMMYVCEGSVTHLIEGSLYTLKAGELLLMNRHVKHSITASGADDMRRQDSAAIPISRILRMRNTRKAVSRCILFTA